MRNGGDHQTMAPALALLTTGLSGELLRAQLSTPAAPRKNADRKAAPKFIWMHMFCKSARARTNLGFRLHLTKLQRRRLQELHQQHRLIRLSALK